MKFGVFDYIEGGDAPLQKTYEERLVLVRALEDAGFTGYHLSEHHATPLSMTPSPSIFLAAAARETKRIRLGTLLYLLPLYHPLRLALTGLEAGPELKALLPLMGRARVEARLMGRKG